MSAPIGYNAPPLVSASGAPTEDEDILALVEEEQKRQEEERQRLMQQAQGQQQAATGLRRLGLVTGMGTNPLLQGFSAKALGQASALDSTAARTEGRIPTSDKFNQQIALTRLRSSLRPPPTGKAALSDDPKSESSQRIRVQVKELYPDLPDTVLDTITERNGQPFLRGREGAGRLANQTSQQEQQAQQFATMMGYRWANLRQDERLALMRIAAAEGNKSDKTVSDLRKEFMNNQVVKDYFGSSIAFQKVENASADPSAAGDMALIYGLMKTFDPTSAVKETEFANAENAKGVPESIRAKWNKVLSGERLTPDQRAEFVRVARGQLSANKDAYERLASGYQGLAPAGTAEKVVLPGVAPTGKPSGLRRVSRPTQSKPATAVLPTDDTGTPTLDSPAPAQAQQTATTQPTQQSEEMVRVKINGKERPRPIPRANVEAMRKRAAERNETFEVIQ